MANQNILFDNRVSDLSPEEFDKAQLPPDKLGEALRLTRQSPNNENIGFQRFD